MAKRAVTNFSPTVQLVTQAAQEVLSLAADYRQDRQWAFKALGGEGEISVGLLEEVRQSVSQEVWEEVSQDRSTRLMEELLRQMHDGVPTIPLPMHSAHPVRKRLTAGAIGRFAYEIHLGSSAGGGLERPGPARRLRGRRTLLPETGVLTVTSQTHPGQVAFRSKTPAPVLRVMFALHREGEPAQRLPVVCGPSHGRGRTLTA